MKAPVWSRTALAALLCGWLAIAAHADEPAAATNPDKVGKPAATAGNDDDEPAAAAGSDAAMAEAPRYSAALENWFYLNRTGLTDASLLNPGNRLARIPGEQALADLRVNLRAESGPLDVLLAPRLLAERDAPGPQTDASVRGQLSNSFGSPSLTQGFVRAKLGGDTLLLGRELLAWGPATFRSPSNPFYFDAGRTNPLAAPSGVDLARVTHAVGSLRVTAAWVESTSQLPTAPDLGRTALLKLDQQGDNYLISLNTAHQTASAGGAHFTGGFAQFTPSDAWLLYAEFGAARQPAPSGNSALAGASYTLEDGKVFTAEYLHDQGGFTRSGEQGYFAPAVLGNQLLPSQAAAGYGLIGQTLAGLPRLMGRDYLWLGLNSNAQESNHYWRVEWTQNLSDRSAQALVYVEKNFVPKLSGFIALTRNWGGANTDFGNLWRSRVTLGVKWFAV